MLQGFNQQRMNIRRCELLESKINLGIRVNEFPSGACIYILMFLDIQVP